MLGTTREKKALETKRDQLKRMADDYESRMARQEGTLRAERNRIARMEKVTRGIDDVDDAAAAARDDFLYGSRSTSRFGSTGSRTRRSRARLRRRK